MKWLLVLVVVLNLLVAMYGSFKQRPPLDVHAQEVSPNQVKLLPAGWAPAAAASEPAASAPLAVVAPHAASAARAEASAPAAKAKAPEAKPESKPESKPEPAKPAKSDPAKPEPSKAEAAKPAAACYQWGPLSDSLLARVQGGLPQLKLKKEQQSSASSEDSKGSGRFWVYYPPLATQAETQTLSAELKGKGFDNYIVSNDEFKGNLSLGLFGKEDAAKTLAARLKAAGYDKAKVQPKGQKTTVTTLSFKQLDAVQADKLKALQQRLTPGIALKSCGN